MSSTKTHGVSRVVFWEIVVLMAASSSMAQRSPLAPAWEIFFTVEHPTASIIISVDPTDEGHSSPDTVSATANWYGPYDWGADTNCENADPPGWDLACNRLYTVRFDVVGSNNDLEFQYEMCESGAGEGYDAEVQGFYCLSDNPDQHDLADIYITYTSEGVFTIRADQVYRGEIQLLTDVFTGDSWVWPHDKSRFCGSDSDCLNAAADVAYFLTPQVDDTTDYTLSASEIVVPGGSPYPYSESWTWNDKTVRFASGQELIVSGEFHADGSTFEAASGTWDGIRFDTGSTGTLESTTITDVSTASGAVRVFNYYGGTTSVLFDDVLLDNPDAEYGIYATGYGSEPVVHNTSITGSSSGVLFNSSARGEMWQSVTEVDGIAVDADYYASPYLRPYPDHDEGGSNEIGGGYMGIRAQHTASVYAGDTTYPGDNQFCSGMESDADATSPAYIEARKNYWPGGTPDVGGNVVVNPYYEEASSCGGVGGKGLAGPVTATVGAESDAAERLAEAVNRMHGAVSLEGAAERAVSFDEVALALRKIRADESGSEMAGAALVALSELAGLEGSDRYLADLEALAASEGPDRATALGLLIQAYPHWGRRADARRAAESLAGGYPGTWHAFYAGLSLFEMELADGDVGAAEAILSSLEPSDQSEERHWEAAWEELGRQGSGQAHPREGWPTSPIAVETNALADATAYPNPFNPATTVGIRLTGKAWTEVAVFDGLGRKVDVIWRGDLEAGDHAWRWDAGRRVSGTYFVVIRAGGRTRSMPVVLLK